MKKTLLVSLFFFAPLLSFAAAAPAYIPLEPLPFVTSNMGELTFADLLSGLFKLSLVLGAAITAVMLTIGGIQYMLSDAANSKQAGKDRLRNATLGFFLLFGIYAILNTVSPELLKFNVGGIVNVGCPPSDPGRCKEKKTDVKSAVGPAPYYTVTPDGQLRVGDGQEAGTNPNGYNLTYVTGLDGNKQPIFQTIFFVDKDGRSAADRCKSFENSAPAGTVIGRTQQIIPGSPAPTCLPNQTN